MNNACACVADIKSVDAAIEGILVSWVANLYLIYTAKRNAPILANLWSVVITPRAGKHAPNGFLIVLKGCVPIAALKLAPNKPLLHSLRCRAKVAVNVSNSADVFAMTMKKMRFRPMFVLARTETIIK